MATNEDRLSTYNTWSATDKGEHAEELYGSTRNYGPEQVVSTRMTSAFSVQRAFRISKQEE